MSLAIQDMVECVTVEIILQNRKNILVTCLYRVPDSQKIHEFKDWMVKMFNDNFRKDVIICGDFNVNLLVAKKHIPTTELINELFSMNLYPLITKPSRITQHSATLIDNIFTNVLDSNVTSGLLLTDISDHLPIFMVYDINYKIKKNNNFSYGRVITEKSITALKTDLSFQNWEIVYGESDVNAAYNSFLQEFVELYNKNCPLKKYKEREEKNTPLITNGLRNACKKKNYLYQIFLKNRTKQAEIKYKKYKNKLTTIMREVKKDYYTKQLDTKRNNIKEMWKVLNTAIGRGIKTSCFPEFFVENNRVIRDKEEIVDCFNNFFTNVGPELAKKIPPTNITMENLIDINSKSMFLSPVSEEELFNTIKKCHNKTSRDVNDINMKTIRSVAEEIIKPLTYICNLSFQNGQFPSKMKTAKIIPMYKSGDKHCFNNYRPVSLLPQFSKILEKLFDTRLRNFIEKHNLLSESQYGFRKNRSTSLALIDLMEEITSCLDAKKYVIGIFIDLKKRHLTLLITKF